MARSMRNLFLLLLLVVGRASFAQVCDFPLCDPGTMYTGGTGGSDPRGTCQHCLGFPLFWCSHTVERCPSGSTLDVSTGVCTWNLCTGGCGGELPLCPSTERYTGSGTDSTGTYGVCQNGPHYVGGPISHRIVRCREGWRLLTASGMCRKDCLPDLDITSAWLLDASGSVVSSVRVGRPYYVCAVVRNVGTVTSPGCVLSGGGLGVPTPPAVALPSIGATATATRCLYYAGTPSVGTWRVGLTADSANTVSEASESNNTHTVTINVVP